MKCDTYFDRCKWCGRQNTNTAINTEGKVIQGRPCNECNKVSKNNQQQIETIMPNLMKNLKDL